MVLRLIALAFLLSACTGSITASTGDDDDDDDIVVDTDSGPDDPDGGGGPGDPDASPVDPTEVEAV